MGPGSSSFRYPLEEIREKVDIVELVSTYVNLKRSGKALKALCPFHTEKTPSFTVNEDLQRWHCYGCGEHGDVFSFLMKIENMTFSEAVQDLAKKAGVTIQRSPADDKWQNDRDRLVQINSAAASYFVRMLRETPQALAYLQRRGVSQEAIGKYGLGFAPGEWRSLTDFLSSKKVTPPEVEKAGLAVKSEKGSYYDRFRNRIIFPIQDVSGKVIAFGGRGMGDDQPKYLNSPETPAFAKNKTLYGLNLARKKIAQEDRVIIVEGYLDALTVQCAGFENAVATMGTALTPEHINLLSRYTHNAFIAFDSDSAGMAATLRSAPMFEQAGFNVRVIVMPSGSDPDSLLRDGDSATFSRLVDEALPLVGYRLKLLKEVSDLETDQGKSKFLKDAVSILADLATRHERDRYAKDLVQYHPILSGQSASHGTFVALQELHKDIDSFLIKKRRAASGAAPKPAPAQEKAKAPVSAVALAERYLLRAAIIDPVIGPRVLGELPPHMFATEAGGELARVMVERFGEGLSPDWSQLAEAVAGTEAANLLSELSVQDSGPDITEQAIADCAAKLKDNWKRRQLKELSDKVERGEIHTTDLEYLRLVQELHSTLQKKN